MEEVRMTHRITKFIALFCAAATVACSDPVGVDAVDAPLGARLAITVDSDGNGFVGKGDVQSFFGWNNQALQNAAIAGRIQFRLNAVTEWTCTKLVHLGNGGTNEIVQERNNTITGITAITGREHSQGTNGPWTGFILVGSDVTVDGPEVGSCPADASGFEYDDNATTSGSGLQIRQTTGSTTPTGKVSGVWYDFPG
jgi:hypothetical protein